MSAYDRPTWRTDTNAPAGDADAKIQGEEIHDEVPVAPASNVVDLMAALRKSLGDAPQPVDAVAPTAKLPPKRAHTAEDQRKQPGLKLPIEGGRKASETALPVAEPASRPRRRAQ